MGVRDEGARATRGRPGGRDRALSSRLWSLELADRAPSSAQSRSRGPIEAPEEPIRVDFGSIWVDFGAKIVLETAASSGSSQVAFRS